MHVEQVELVGLNAMCGISVVRRDLDGAIEFGEQGVAMSKNCGELWVRGYSLNFLAQGNWLRGDKEYAEAQARGRYNLQARGRRPKRPHRVARDPRVDGAESQAHQRAATLLGCAQHVRETSSLTLIELFGPQHERSMWIAVQGLGQQSFELASPAAEQ